jgi:FOG: WD40-like repeat
MKATQFSKIAIALLIISSISASAFLIPSSFAHTPSWNIPTFAYINAAPNPVGVGQKASIIMWIGDTYDPSSLLSNTYRFRGYQLTITAPDGTVTKQTFDYVSDPTSAQPYQFSPTQTGTYNLTFTFPGQAITASNDDPNSAYVNDTYLPSSASTTLTVQDEQVASLPSNPLPTEYWTRPIYGTNPNWYSVSSNWLGSGAPGYSGFSMMASNQQSNPGDAVGPLTSHVMWTKSLQSGGVVGGNNTAIAGDTYFEGSAYNQRFQNPIILDGKLYYTEPFSFAGASSGPTDCVDLQTGKVIWSRTDVPALSFGYIYDVQDPNQHGVYPPILIQSVGGNFLYGAASVTWVGYDADTGNKMFTVTDVPSGTTMLGPNGEHLILILKNYGTTAKPNWYLQEWNSSKLWEPDYSGASTSPPIVPVTTNGTWTGGYQTVNTGFGFSQVYVPSLYDFNISIPALNTLVGTPTIQDAIYNDMAIVSVGTMPSSSTLIFRTISSSPYTYVGINLAQNSIGNVAWTNTLQTPSGNYTVLAGPADQKTGVFTEAYAESMQWVGYSMSTGQKIWGPTHGQTAFDYYGNPATPNVQGVSANGILYSSGFGGICYAYDMSNGNLLWTYGNGGAGNSTNAGLETAFGEYPTFIQAIGGGVVYLVTTEHTIETPIFKGALARAINASTGAEIWTLSDYTGEFGAMSYAIADGYSTFFNGYSNQIYSVGRGPSQTSVETQAFGNQIVIRGRVTDIATGTTQTEQAARFPSGVPVASDASMKDWMGYVYQQQACPTNFTGVPVSINVLDANGNYRTIGTATTDASGMYTLTWTPDIPGSFTVYAVFAGTNGYYPSSSESSFAYQEQATTAPTSTTAPSSTVDTYFLPSVAAIIIVIIIVGLATILLQRKHP